MHALRVAMIDRLRRTGDPPAPSHDREMAWKVNGERVVLAGWGTAILMQFAHPLVAAGVAEHSVFGDDARAWMRRMSRTVGAMLSLTFGSPDEAATTAARIDAIHGRVAGSLAASDGPYAAGTAYRARDPELLLWVLCTLIYALHGSYELLVGPLSAAEKDRGCIEAHPVGVLLGIQRDLLPMTMAEVDAYLERMIADGPVAVGDTARALARTLFRPPWPRVLLPIVPLVRLPMLALLPPELRAAYGFRWDARRERVVRAMALGSRLLLPLTPPSMRYWRQARLARARLRAAERRAVDGCSTA